MRCPKCRSEVGSQKLCPYCGSPMILPSTKPAPSPETTAQNRLQKTLRNMDYRIAEVEGKVKISLVLQWGNLILLILILTAVLTK